MRIGIIGVGNLGHALGDYLSSNDHQIIGVDDFDITAGFPVYKNYEPLRIADAVFICLPALFNDETKEFDVSLIEKAVREVVKINIAAPIYIKSTVNIGFTRKLANELRIDRLYYTPEFLRQSSAYEDMRNPDRVIIGALNQDDDAVLTYLSLFNSANKFVMAPEEAEAAKLFTNSYLATRIAFFNELDSFAEANHLDSKKIIKAVSTDKRIGDIYNKPSYGYGGYFLPNDSMNLVSHFNVPQKLLEAAILSNDLRKEHIVNQVIMKIAGQKNPLVGIYGIPKKYSPLIDIIRRFKEKSVNVLIYSSGHEYKKYEGYEVTDSLPRFVVDTTIILSEEELPIEFTHLDKVYLK